MRLDLVKFADVFFNGRAAEEAPRPGITVDDLIARRTSTVKYDGKYYRVKVEELEKVENAKFRVKK